MMMGVATNIVAAQLTLPNISSNSSHYHPADSIFDTNILLSHAIRPSLCRYGLVEGSATIRFGVRDFEIIHGFPDFSYDF